jgi:oligopeptide/dipeptide ABC transporter ATP-binding protein
MGTRTKTKPDLLQVRNLCIEVTRIHGTRTLVSSAELDLSVGETIGIVGESGSGKSLTARSIIGLLPENVRARGEIRYRDMNLLDLPERSLSRIRGGEIGLILQDPFTMLNPVHRCGAHIAESLTELPRRMRRAEILRRLREVGIHDETVADRYPFQLSGGMRQRVGIAAALARDPRLLIADEPSTALDVTTQLEILNLLRALQESRGMGLVFITHDLRLAFSMCDRVYVFYAGAVLEIAQAVDIEREPLHPYTHGLLLSEPPLDRRLAALTEIQGAVPQPDDVRDRCPFAARCAWARDACSQGPTPLRPIEDDRLSACIRIDEIREELTAARVQGEQSALATLRASSANRLLEVVTVSKEFVNGRRHVVALNQVSLDLGEGESVGLVGESGSGKTTLGRCIVGLESPDRGQIVVDGVEVSTYAHLNARQRRQVRQTVQMIFQDPYSSLNPARSIGSILAEALTVTGAKSRNVRAAAIELLERVGLPRSYAERRPAALSGGERQRVAIARALAVNPKLIVCDEPVSALDVSVQAQILNLLGKLRDQLGVSYLFITHDLSVVRQMADRIYVLYRGDIVESGLVEDILDRPKHSYTRRLIASVPS